ncbi:MAG: type II toxin-antitoxin system HipA family toxin [Aestuariivita sp.]|nr:type II toxin-antitoxin system HipA family toxin [Aestuariivita sp.]
MTSDSEQPVEAFVWIWLPKKTDPVVAGRISVEHDHFTFTYGRSYLERADAIPIYAPELRLQRGAIAPEPPLTMANALRDASPDAWGRRVIAYRLGGYEADRRATTELNELTFMLRSGSDRIGALDFQASPTEYLPRGSNAETLNALLDSADRVDRGLPLSPDLAEALQHGTAIGGARPKVLIQDRGVKYVAKFSSSTDTYSAVKAEFVAMRLAKLVGLNVTPVHLVRAMNKDVLLVRRFDRAHAKDGWTRSAMVSALTLLGLDERMAAHASYEVFADIVRARLCNPTNTLRELFARMTFNILVGNTDDHARNHAAFWDGEGLALTPAYDICPQSRVGREASQAMQIHGRERRSQLSLCLASANKFLLTNDQALEIMQQQVAVIESNWQSVCEQAELADVERRMLWRRQFLNDLAFEGIENHFRNAGCSF